MKRIWMNYLFVLIVQAGFSQAIRTIKKSDVKFLAHQGDFAYMEKNADTASYEFVASYELSGRCEEGMITKLFYMVKDEARKDGANCFKVNSYVRKDSVGYATIIFDTYYWQEPARINNFESHPMNIIYIFAKESLDEEDITKFKLDDEKKKLRSGYYYKYDRVQGVEVKINKGGLTGMTSWYTLQGNKPALFLTLTGLGMGGGPVSTGMVGVAFNTGRINQMDGNLGLLLVQLLKEEVK